MERAAIAAKEQEEDVEKEGRRTKEYLEFYMGSLLNVDGYRETMLCIYIQILCIHTYGFGFDLYMGGEYMEF